MPAQPVSPVPPSAGPLIDMVGLETIDATPPPPAQVKSVAKAARVLRCFGPGSAALTVRHIAARTGLPRSTCHAIATTLAAENLLEARPGGGYVLGVEMMVMGGQVVARSGLVDAATPTMGGLAAATGAEIHLGYLDDEGCVVYLHRVRVCHRIQARNWFGLRVPAHRTGCGKAALSKVEPARVHRIALAHGLDQDDAHRLARELAVARITGYVTCTTYQPGLASVAAPVVGWDGEAIGALSVADRRESFTRWRVASLGANVRDAAETVSRQLRYPTCAG